MSVETNPVSEHTVAIHTVLCGLQTTFLVEPVANIAQFWAAMIPTSKTEDIFLTMWALFLFVDKRNKFSNHTAVVLMDD